MSTSAGRSGTDLEWSVRTIATEEALSGVVRLDVDGQIAVDAAFGYSHRGLGIEMTTDAQLATASGSKTFTALVVMSLVETGDLTLDTPVRSILGDDLPLVDDRVTVEHLLAHRSGIGDYLDEDAVEDWDAYLMPVPVHELVTTDDYLRVLDGHPAKFAPGERFSYSNGGYVILALIIERVSGRSFHDLVDQRVCRPAGMIDTAFFRSDSLPGRAALGYLDEQGLATNVFHLPVRGSGDGGIYTTAADIHAFWDALMAGRIVSPDTVAEMTRWRSDATDGLRYGLGFWLGEGDTVSIHGFDTGVGFVSVHDPRRGVTFSVLSNHRRCAWPCSQRISQLVAGI
ncbi:MAG TPA: serine hydrolase domain-containing protein [Ilumatobacteraceae bacterium]|nr:serine hydrolase domain-containing protein [Ilumatobacteraceae bacterium]